MLIKKSYGESRIENAHSAGVEPTTSASGGLRSIQMSYECRRDGLSVEYCNATIEKYNTDKAY